MKSKHNQKDKQKASKLIAINSSTLFQTVSPSDKELKDSSKEMDFMFKLGYNKGKEEEQERIIKI